MHKCQQGKCYGLGPSSRHGQGHQLSSAAGREVLLYSSSRCLKASLGWAWTIEEGSREHPSLELGPQKMPLLLGSCHEASILLGSPGQVRQHFIHGSVGNVFVDREASLA